MPASSVASSCRTTRPATLTPEVGGEPAQPAGVLGGDHVRGGQRVPQPGAGVGRVAQRGAGQHQRALARHRVDRLHPASLRPPAAAPLGPRSAPAHTIARMAATLEAAPPDAPSPADPPARRRRAWAPLAMAPMPDDLALSWVATGFVTAIAALVRLWGIGFPPAKQFDEIYYATEGAEMLRQGYENNPGYMFIVHPPLGKWLIAAGIAVFGDGPVGWRVPAAVAGTLCVLLLIRIVRRMTRSTLLGCVAGLLLAVDGLSIVQSRFALLDIFLAVFVLAGFGCLVVDRDRFRDRLARLSRIPALVPESAAPADRGAAAASDRRSPRPGPPAAAAGRWAPGSACAPGGSPAVSCSVWPAG